MFQYFPGNTRWSAGVLLSIMAGGQIGQIDRHLSRLRDTEPDDGEWSMVWDAAAAEQVKQAESDVAAGRSSSAVARLLHASTYYLTGERQAELGPVKTASYQGALDAFGQALTFMDSSPERVEVPSPDGILPGYLVPAQGSVGPAPVVIFYNGFDVTKEILYGIIGNRFAENGIACLVIDTPGTGEPLRLRNVPSRPDYEVPTSAIVDYLETRDDIDSDNIGLLGISLGGYYAPRGAAFEHRIKAVVAWGAIWDYGATWAKRWATQSTDTPTPYFQLPWVMGTDTMEAALERVIAWKLEDALPNLTQPFLIVHGSKDGIPVSDAEKAIAAAASKDKELKVFNGIDGGAAHVNADDPDPARQYIIDWFLAKLVTA